MGKLLKCSVLHTREITIPNCKDEPSYCTRKYQLFLPDILCSGKSRRRLLEQDVAENTTADEDNYFEGEYYNVGTIPMAFALHGFGKDFRSMTGLAQGANDYHILLILPEGINNSFNANGCCGSAQKLGIHDDDFLHHIQQHLSDEFTFLKPQYSYGIGWDNGALLLTEALVTYPQLFRAIVPISGLFSRSWIPSTIGTGIGIMMHHSLDDDVFRPSGCCDDDSLPSCQGDFKADSCVSFLDSFDLWARGVNLCDTDVSEKHDGTGSNDLLVGGKDEFLYSLFHKDGATSMELVTGINEDGEDTSTILSTSEVSLSVTQKKKEYVCLRTTSSSCVSSSTLCVYKSMGHFDGFISTPFMSNHVMRFLARDACSVNDGSWNQVGRRNKKVCGCETNGFDGVFCLDETSDDIITITSAVSDLISTTPEVRSSDEIQPMRLPAWCVMLIAAALIVAAVIMFVSLRLYRRKSQQSLHSNVDLHTNDAASMLRGFNPYRDQFKMKSKDSYGDSQNRLPNRRVGNNSPLDSSARSLDADDMELLQFYREKSDEGDSCAKLENDMPNDRFFDKELLESYRRREQIKQQFIDADCDVNTSLGRNCVQRKRSVEDNFE